MNTSKRKKKVGLALSGGAARGIAHIGVLQVLREEQIPIDMIAGTSAGAAIGAVYAAGQNIDRLAAYAIDADWKRLAPLIDPSFPKTGFIKGRKITKLLSTYVGGNIKFSDLKIPLSCVATDIDTGEEVVIDRGSLLEALRATISIPGIFTVVKREGRHLVDGGLTTPVPARWSFTWASAGASGQVFPELGFGFRPIAPRCSGATETTLTSPPPSL